MRHDLGADAVDRPGGRSVERPGGSSRLLRDVRRNLRRFGHARRAFHAIRRFTWRIRDLGYFLPLPLPHRTLPDTRLIVSLTSFPARIGHVALTIESIQRQALRPHRIVLVLAEPQFPARRLPWLLRLQAARRDVRILWVAEDTRSYKKLVPVRQRHPDATVVTVDDDVIYGRSFLQELVTASRKHPGAIIGCRGWELQVSDGKLEPYGDSPHADPTSPQERVLLTGIGGILYPPTSLPDTLLADPAARMLCPTADDIWFWALARVHGTRTVCIWRGVKPYRATVALQSSVSLGAVNNLQGANDLQLGAAVRHFGLEPLLGLAATAPATSPPCEGFERGHG